MKTPTEIRMSIEESDERIRELQKDPTKENKMKIFAIQTVKETLKWVLESN